MLANFGVGDKTWSNLVCKTQTKIGSKGSHLRPSLIGFLCCRAVCFSKNNWLNVLQAKCNWPTESYQIIPNQYLNLFQFQITQKCLNTKSPGNVYSTSKRWRPASTLSFKKHPPSVSPIGGVLVWRPSRRLSRTFTRHEARETPPMGGEGKQQKGWFKGGGRNELKVFCFFWGGREGWFLICFERCTVY